MPLVYVQHKIKHSGILSYKVFEGFSRSMSKNSLANLHLSNKYYTSTDDEGNEITLKEVTTNDSIKFPTFSLAMAKRCKTYCQKLTYYSATRYFTGKGDKKYSMKVGFITLTAPNSFKNEEIEAAFQKFIDYLHRTANCEYVYKKELGSKSGYLHYHILVNNFVPYYIIRDKWKRLLMNENYHWPTDESGKPYSAHYRVELPRKAKVVASYIAKYMSKEQVFPSACGRLWGKSKLLDSIEEATLIENDLPIDEYTRLLEKYKVIKDTIITLVCCDPLKLKKIAPEIYACFEFYYMKASQLITHEQRFKFVGAC